MTVRLVDIRIADDAGNGALPARRLQLDQVFSPVLTLPVVQDQADEELDQATWEDAEWR